MRYALRQLAKNPGFTAFALATLALGIGVNTTAFTALNRLLLQSLPFRDPGRLVQIWSSTSQQGYWAQSPGDYIDECDQNTVFENVAAFTPGAHASLAEPGQPPAQYVAIRVTANFFPLFGVQAQMGRTFTEAEDRHLDPLAVVSNSFWHEHYGSDPKILGRTAKLNSKVYTIVGVMQPALDDPTLFEGKPAFFLLDGTRVNTNYRAGNWYHVAARLKPGVTLKQAQAEMDALAQKLAHDFPKTNATRGLKVVPFPANSMGEVGAELTWLVMAVSGVVLLIACVNLANLQLVRTTRRAQEIAIRLALGCSRARLVGLLLTESLVVSVAGGALGLLIAKWSNGYVARFFEIDMPLDVRVIGFTFAAALLTGGVFGTVPAWLASRADINCALNTSGRGATSHRSRHWLRQGLVVLELALALTLLAGAGFFVSGIYKVTHRDLGWHGDNVVVGYIELDHDHFGEQKDPRSLAFGDRMLAKLRALPGAEAAALSMDSPAWGLRGTPFRVEGQPAPEPGKEDNVGATNASPGYLRVYGIPLVQGRDFDEADHPGAPAVVIVNESMARKYWPGESPIGKRIGGTDPANPDWAEVVGVMADFAGAADFYNPNQDSSRFLRPWAQNNHRFITFNVRSAGDPRPFKETVRKAMALLAPDVALSMVQTAPEIMDEEVSYFSFLRRMLLQTSALGFLLAVVGIYGVVANLAAERTREIGIRMALGAQPGGLVWLFVKNGGQLALLGAAVGLTASFFLVRFLGKMLPALPGSDPWVVVTVAAALVASALVACWLPARRTTKTSPMIALRAE
ncbi:MAG: ABC transporter permease [Opitutaceae bacterium]|jgi:predicted permease